MDVMWLSLGFCYKNLGKMDLSKMYYEKSLEKWNENPSALSNLSEIYYFFKALEIY